VHREQMRDHVYALLSETFIYTSPVTRTSLKIWRWKNKSIQDLSTDREGW
jgi:hypothetical protein